MSGDKHQTRWGRHSEAGFSLISMALFIVGIGLVSVVCIRLYDQYKKYEVGVVTTDRLDAIHHALQIYFVENGFYPCPAALTEPVDTGKFGREIRNGADPAKCDGSFSTTGRGGRIIWNGAIPVRTLNLPDEVMVDGWNHRFVYAVTEAYVREGVDLGADLSAIAIHDAADNNATSIEGNITYALITQGPDSRGAFSFNGSLEQTCETASKAGRNCTYQTDPDSGGTFVNTVVHSNASNANSFTHRVEYRSVTAPACVETANFKKPGNIAYLVDTSKSMEEDAACPASLGAKCSRIDVARWAMRRVMPVALKQMKQNAAENDPDKTKTLLSGFVYSKNDITKKIVKDHLGTISYTDEEKAESKIEALCPEGKTPLGVHIETLADEVGDGTEDHPSKILVVSDGLNNVGDDPVKVAKKVHALYPYLQIDIIDVTGNPSLQEVADITGGKYALSMNGETILDTLIKLSGICNAAPATPPVDKPGCGSKGNWWK